MSVRLDPRLLAAGQHLTTTLLVTLWADHTPAHTPTPSTCPGCCHRYSLTEPLCPTAAAVRPWLRRHRARAAAELARLTFNQSADLTAKYPSTTPLHAAPAPVIAAVKPAGLFDTITPAPRQVTP